jgi:preprotein translocase subunit SecG
MRQSERWTRPLLLPILWNFQHLVALNSARLGVFMNLLVVLHIIIAVALIALVLVQDSKGGGALGIGGGSNSLLGATGAQTLYAKATRWVALIFGITCIWLSIQAAHESRSVIDNAPIVNTPPASEPAPVNEGAPAPPPAQNTSQPENK